MMKFRTRTFAGIFFDTIVKNIANRKMTDIIHS